MSDRGETDAEWVTGTSRSLYSSRWLDLQLVQVTPPGGEAFEHHVVRMQRVAVSVVLDEVGERVLMIRRHRFIDDSWGWEVPVGIVEPGERSIDTGLREVEEETGWRPRGLELSLSFQPAIGIADSPHDVLSGRGADLIGAPTDRTEAAEVDWIQLSALLPLISDGQIRDGATLVALLHLLVLRRDA
ncbi:NUDIX hydrolase [Nocardioides iriomotensis]|uniref:NUDIX hydrolase n=1 Tax=Nocardioides iriomotensis TaxID=715784 RepID=A0A4Q5J885_9ACTN|nr:NUDIX hydrolase [Nocardioides iriomotensis]RYU14804.1 NUDIX hydrolase [Nocardioides iriomotensis]